MAHQHIKASALYVLSKNNYAEKITKYIYKIIGKIKAKLSDATIHEKLKNKLKPTSKIVYTQ